MITFLIVMACIFGYGSMAGLTYTKTVNSLRRRCVSCQRGGGWCHADHPFPSAFAGAFWPIGMPFMFTAMATDTDARKATKAQIAQQQVEQRIEQARLEEQAIAQERHNLESQIRNLEIENNMLGRRK